MSSSLTQHQFRSFNDGLQPWFADRTRFGIRGLSCLEQLRTEEGLAAINTVLNAKVKYLWGPALLYCKYSYVLCQVKIALEHAQTKCADSYYPEHAQSIFQGPVVQSIVNLTSSLRAISITVLADSIYNILIFFAEKM